MTTSAKQKVTIALDAHVYQQLKDIVGSRGVGDYVSAIVREKLPQLDIEQGYQAMAEYEKSHPNEEMLEWENAPIDAEITE
jgi:hypothetical protein